MRVGSWVAPTPAHRPALLQLALETAQRCAAQGPAEPALQGAALVIGGAVALLHALPDGNGRTARALSWLVAEGYDGTDSDSLSMLVSAMRGRAGWSVGAETMSLPLMSGVRERVGALLDEGRFADQLNRRPVGPDDVAVCLVHRSGGLAVEAVARLRGVADPGSREAREAVLATLQVPEHASEFVAADERIRSLMFEMYLDAIEGQVVGRPAAVPPSVTSAAADAVAEFSCSRDWLQRVSLPSFDCGVAQSAFLPGRPSLETEPLVLGPVPRAGFTAAIPPAATMRVRLKPAEPRGTGLER
jgi:hypothetical protein